MSKPNLRLAALRRFAVTITVLNLLGRTILGFENSWAQMFVALACGLLNRNHSGVRRRPGQQESAYDSQAA